MQHWTNCEGGDDGCNFSGNFYPFTSYTRKSIDECIFCLICSIQKSLLLMTYTNLLVSWTNCNEYKRKDFSLPLFLHRFMARPQGNCFPLPLMTHMSFRIILCCSFPFFALFSSASVTPLPNFLFSLNTVLLAEKNHMAVNLLSSFAKLTSIQIYIFYFLFLSLSFHANSFSIFT